MSALAPTRVQHGGVVNPLQQAAPDLMVMRAGIDFVAHFDQQRDVGAGPETGIQAKDGSYGRRTSRILMFETLQAFPQPGFLRRRQGECGLLALDLLGKVRHDLQLAGVLPLPSRDLLAGVGELTMRALRLLPVLVVGDQRRQRRCGRLPACSARLQLGLGGGPSRLALCQPLLRLVRLLALGLPALAEQLGPAPGPHARAGFRRQDQFFGQQTGHQITWMRLGGEPVPAIKRTADAHDRRLVAQPHFIVHVAESGLRISGAGTGRWPPGQTAIVDQAALRRQGLRDLLIDQRLADLT